VANNGGNGLGISTTGPINLSNLGLTGNASNGMVVNTSNTLVARNNVIQNQRNGTGLVIDTAALDSEIADNTVASNLYPLRTFPDLIERCLRDNDVRDVQRGIQVSGNQVTTETAWPPDYPYVISSDLNITDTGHLTLEGGAVVKFAVATSWHNDIDITVDGRLTTQGEARVVTLTTLTHDITGDTNGDGVASLPAPGNWGRVYARNNAVLDIVGTEMAYGGGGNDGRCCANARATDAILSIAGGQATVRNSAFRHSMADGIRVTGGTGSVADNELTDNADRGLRITAAICGDWQSGGTVRERNGNGDAEGVCP
jgi:hypothetical protein